MREKAATAGAKYTKKVMKSASPQVANALGGLGFNKDQLQAKAMQKIEDCVARQRGPLQVCACFFCGFLSVVCVAMCSVGW